MKILNFFRFNDRKKEQVADDASDYIHKKKNEFQGEMGKLAAQSKKLHRSALQTQEEAVKMNKIVNDITSKIALATPGGRK